MFTKQNISSLFNGALVTVQITLPINNFKKMSDKNPEVKFQPNPRKLKKLYNKIRKQMEFYFSDSNLAKDKFLVDLISKDPDGFVDIDVFKRFNKIKALTNSSEAIAESVSKSDLFEVSADCKKIRRTAPLDLSKDFDACTLYVERLPPNADPKWVKDVLGQFGQINYVNVPRFKATNRIKGFAFVEFESPEGVKKACDFYFKVPSEKECTASEDEDRGTKSGKRHKHEELVFDKKNKKGYIRSVSESSDKLPVFSPVKTEQNQDPSEKNSEPHQKQKKKRKRCCSESEALKKPKVSTDELPNTSITKEFASENLIVSDTKASFESKAEQPGIRNINLPAQPDEQITDEEKIEVSNTYINGTSTDVVKAKRKRKNSKKHRAHAEKPILRVMPKVDWKAYRTKYLDLQRSTMKLLKKQILHEMQEFKEQECSTKPVDVVEVKKSSLQFMPGIIIKVKLNEPVKNPSEIKTQVRANAVVAYVDAPIDSPEIFIRCHNSEDAQTILKEKKLHHLGKAQLTDGEEEKKYWDKIESDRKNKLNNPVIHKKRGRDKLIAKAAKLEEIKNKHIYFDD